METPPIKNSIRSRRIFILLILLGIVLGSSVWIIEKTFKGIPTEERFKNLDVIILENTEFRDFNMDGFYLKYPNWIKVEIDPLMIWPREIAEKEKILLYLTSPDGVRILLTKRELSPRDFNKPYPLVLRGVFEDNQEVFQKEGSLTDWRIIKEKFFENGVFREEEVVIFGMPTTSVSKSIIIGKNDKRYVYSVGISARKDMFEDYRLLANYVTDSFRYIEAPLRYY